MPSLTRPDESGHLLPQGEGIPAAEVVTHPLGSRGRFAAWFKEFGLFGSVLREDFGPESDVDVLVTLEEDAPWGLFEWVDMIDELTVMFGRKLDLLEKTALRNPYRRRHILNSYRVLYASR